MPKRFGDAFQLAIQQRTHHLSVLPILILYLNDICNSQCLTCGIWQNNVRLKLPAQREMADQLLDGIYGFIRQWRPRQVLLSGGEPTMHPKFVEVVRTIGDVPSSIGLVTNGLLLSTFATRELQRISEYYLSFDAYDARSYEMIRGVDGFSKVARAVDALNSLPARPQITARCTLQRGNVRHLRSLIAAAQEMGFHRISFLCVDLHTDAFAREYSDHAVDRSRIQPDAADLKEMAVELAGISGTDSDSFIEGGLSRLQRLLQYFRAVNGEEEFPDVRCNAPWFSTVIDTAGRLHGCFFHRVIGDYREINGPDAVGFRQALRVEDNEVCRRCVCNKHLTSWDLVRM